MKNERKMKGGETTEERWDRAEARRSGGTMRGEERGDPTDLILQE